MVNWIDHIDSEVDGTPVNRKNLMAMQGFESVTTTFGADGSIVETNAKGETLTTTFDGDKVIETFVGGNGMAITKTTTLNADGSVREVVTE